MASFEKVRFMLLSWIFKKESISTCLSAVFFCLLYFFSPQNACAHFNHFQPRVVHIAQEGRDIDIFVRIPLPLLLLPENWKGMSKGQDILFTTKRQEGDKWKYVVDGDAVKQNWEGFVSLIKKGHIIKGAQNEPIDFSLSAVSIFTIHERKTFSTLRTAKRAFPASSISVRGDKIDPFDAVIDIKMTVPNQSIQEGFLLQSYLGTHLNIIDSLMNIVRVYRDGQSKVHTSIGVLDIDIQPEGFNFHQSWSQLKSGVWHILIGLDHILFVVLIVLAAGSWLAVIKNATWFTIGHSITLCLGVLGYIPKGAWFIPAVELVIALTILYGALAIVFGKAKKFNFLTVFLIGLIHGFGFSFVLSDVLQEAGGLTFSNIFLFNIGIEIGQILIYLAMIPLIILSNWLFSGRNFQWQAMLGALVALMGAYWVIERSMVLISAHI